MRWAQQGQGTLLIGGSSLGAELCKKETAAHATFSTAMTEKSPGRCHRQGTVLMRMLPFVGGSFPAVECLCLRFERMQRKYASSAYREPYHEQQKFLLVYFERT